MREGLLEELEGEILARYRFFVPGSPVSTNDLYGHNRFGGFWKTKEAKEWEQAIGWGAKQAGVRVEESRGVRLSILYCHHGRKRKDLDNIMKVVMDGLNGVAWRDDRQIEELFVQPQSVAKDAQVGLLLTIRVSIEEAK